MKLQAPQVAVVRAPCRQSQHTRGQADERGGDAQAYAITRFARIIGQAWVRSVETRDSASTFQRRLPLAIPQGGDRKRKSNREPNPRPP